MRTVRRTSSRRGAACWALILAASVLTGCAAPRRLPVAVYLDKLEGAWIGQMVGVAYGAPYEFRARGHIDEGEFRAWRPEYIANAIQQDDLYVEMTWLACLEEHGLDLTPGQAGAAFAATQFPLWHANHAGRENVRKGLIPPDSGAPANNPHANDIDYQIEADAIGILCPGLPQEANRLGWTFGHVMNHGDGVYGGLFMQGMYCAAYFEGPGDPRGRAPDVVRVVEAGLACIPARSRYARCIRDVLDWHADEPADWRATWQKIEAKYNDDRDCEPGKPFNINAHLNGAYVVMGLLYGGDDFWEVCEIATRCGQDSDCNPSSAAGVWGGMYGRSALPPEASAGLEAVADQKFQYTRYSYGELLDICRKLTEQIVLRSGGRITPEYFEIRTQQPTAAPLEQWEGPSGS
ncbi:MAG: ADP-ribosylglycohydrolase family protein [Planctomycetota bacterium]